MRETECKTFAAPQRANSPGAPWPQALLMVTRFPAPPSVIREVRLSRDPRSPLLVHSFPQCVYLVAMGHLQTSHDLGLGWLRAPVAVL